MGWKAWSVWKPRISRRSQHGVVFCSQILFFSATVAFRTNFLPLADFKSDLSRTNLKLPSGQLGPQSPQMFSLWTGHWSNFPFLAIFFPNREPVHRLQMFVYRLSPFLFRLLVIFSDHPRGSPFPQTESLFTGYVTYGFHNMGNYREHMGRSLGLEIC